MTFMETNSKLSNDTYNEGLGQLPWRRDLQFWERPTHLGTRLRPPQLAGRLLCEERSSKERLWRRKDLLLLHGQLGQVAQVLLLFFSNDNHMQSKSSAGSPSKMARWASADGCWRRRTTTSPWPPARWCPPSPSPMWVSVPWMWWRIMVGSECLLCVQDDA